MKAPAHLHIYTHTHTQFWKGYKKKIEQEIEIEI